MATTTVRLDSEEEQTLNELAEIHGGRSNVLRKGLRLVEMETRRRATLTELLADWEDEYGPVSEAAIDAMTERYRLDS
ncbi:MAG: hypothetical protein V3V01_04135 [Acidimicrobiales bacterium]